MKKKSLFLAIFMIATSLVVGIVPSTVAAHEEEVIVVNDDSFDPTTNNPPITTINWDQYKETGFDMAFTSAQSSTLGNGSADHIQLINNEVKFFGYYSDPYLDFLYYTESDKLEKEFTFNIRQDEMDWHTINSVGFFVNCIKNEDGTYSGYFFSLERSQIALRMIDHFDMETYHKRGGIYLMSSSKIVDSQSIFTGTNDSYAVKLKSEEKKFSIAVTRTASDSSVSQINFDLDLATASLYDVPTDYVGGNDFGIYSAYQSHYCSDLSYATFSDITILSKTTRPVGEVNVSFVDYASDNLTAIKDAISVKGYEGQNFAINPPKQIGDYVYVASSVNVNDGTYTLTPQNVQLSYVHPKYTVEYVDEDGKVLSTESIDKGLALQEYKVNAKKITGYKVKGDNTKTFTLSKDAPVQKVKFVYTKEKATTIKAPSTAPTTGDSTNVQRMLILGALSLISFVVVKIKERK